MEKNMVREMIPELDRCLDRAEAYGVSRQMVAKISGLNRITVTACWNCRTSTGVSTYRRFINGVNRAIANKQEFIVGEKE